MYNHPTYSYGSMLKGKPSDSKCLIFQTLSPFICLMPVNRWLLLLIFLNSSLTVFSQELWTSLTPRYELSDAIRLSLDHQVRLENQFRDIKTAFIAPEIALTPFRFLELKTGYRHYFEPSARKRISQDLKLMVNTEKKFRPEFRTSFQHEWGETYQDHLRGQLEFNYRHSDDLKPYVSSELFYRFNKLNVLDQVRFTVGLKTELLRFLSADVFYRIDQELKRERPEQTKIIGAGLTVDIHKLSKKKE